MTRALRVCSQPGCPNLTPSGRCAACRRSADRSRGTARSRGYDSDHERFRAAVLARDPICVLCRQRPSVQADHYPLDRRQLVARGLEPNDPQHGRGLCTPCHSTSTARDQPGGWNR